jgi:hypothetical protein
MTDYFSNGLADRFLTDISTQLRHTKNNVDRHNRKMDPNSMEHDPENARNWQREDTQRKARNAQKPAAALRHARQEAINRGIQRQIRTPDLAKTVTTNCALRQHHKEEMWRMMMAGTTTTKLQTTLKESSAYSPSHFSLFHNCLGALRNKSLS